MHSRDSVETDSMNTTNQKGARRFEALLKDPAFRAKRRRQTVAGAMAVMVAQSGATRTRVAERACMKASQLSRQLSGDINLTIDSIGKICEAVGWDFDVVFRLAHAARAKQPWEVGSAPINRSVLFEIVKHRSNFSLPADPLFQCAGALDVTERPAETPCASANEEPYEMLFVACGS